MHIGGVERHKLMKEPTGDLQFQTIKGFMIGFINRLQHEREGPLNIGSLLTDFRIIGGDRIRVFTLKMGHPVPLEHVDENTTLINDSEYYYEVLFDELKNKFILHDSKTGRRMELKEPYDFDMNKDFKTDYIT